MPVILHSNMQATKHLVTEHARNTVRATAAEILSGARTRVPVQTGYLKNTGHLRFEDGGMSCVIAFSANYAAYVELGTSRRGATPYLKPAFDAAIPGFKKALAL